MPLDESNSTCRFDCNVPGLLKQIPRCGLFAAQCRRQLFSSGAGAAQMGSVEDAVPAELLPPEAQGLVFDCDGTLVDSMAYHYDAWKAAAVHFGLDALTPKLLVELAGKPVNELFAAICERSGKAGQVDRDAYFAIRDKHYRENDRPAVPIESVVRIAKAGKAKGLPMAVASGGTRHHVIKSLTETGLIDLFSAVVTGEDVSRGKPAPDGFLLAASKLGIDPAHCVGYEDAKLGMEAIRAAGFLAAIDVTVFPDYPHFA